MYMYIHRLFPHALWKQINKSGIIYILCPSIHIAFTNLNEIPRKKRKKPLVHGTQKPWLVERALACDWICLEFDPSTPHFILLLYPNSCCPTTKGRTRICPPQFRVITERLPH